MDWKAYGSSLIAEIIPEETIKTKSGFEKAGKQNETEIESRWAEGKVLSIGKDVKEQYPEVKGGSVVMFSLYNMRTPKLGEVDSKKLYAIINIADVVAIKKQGGKSCQ